MDNRNAYKGRTHPLPYIEHQQQISEIFQNELHTAILRIEAAPTGLKTRVFFVTTPQGRYAIHFPKKHRYRIPAQAWALRQWEKLGIPAPRLIAYGGDYIIEEKIDGTPLNHCRLTLPQQQRIMHEAGVILRKMHIVKTKGYGYLKKPGQGSHKTWKGFIEPKFRLHLSFLEKEQLLSKELIQSIRQVYTAQKEILQYHDPRLLHMDLTASNILIKDGRLKAIIDPSDVAFGDPHYGLGLKNAYYFDDQLLKPFFEGYGKVDMQKVQFYSLLHIIRLSYFFYAQVPRRELVSLFIERIKRSVQEAHPPIETGPSWSFLQQLSSVSNI